MKNLWIKLLCLFLPAGQHNDSRKTIYWSSDIATDATGKATFEYCNAATPGNYRVVEEGIDTNGRLARKVFTYKVQ